MEQENASKKDSYFFKSYLWVNLLCYFFFLRFSQADHLRSRGVLRSHSVLPAGERPLWDVGNDNRQ